MRYVILAVFAVLIGVWAFWPGPRPVSHDYFSSLSGDSVEVIAHGGGLGVRPGNTLAALDQAMADEADVLEIDLVQSRDGELVLIHDLTLDRTTDLTGPVAAHSVEQLRQADAAYGMDNGDESWVGQGIHVPTLREALLRYPDARWVMEIKNPGETAARRLCSALRDLEATERTLVASFHDDAMRVFRTACPEVATSMSSGETRTFYILARLGLSRFHSTPAAALQIPVESGGINLTNGRFINAAHQRGLKIQYWTINDTAEMERLIALGADGLITDYVARARGLQD